MKTFAMQRWFRAGRWVSGALLLACGQYLALATVPVVKTVPWVASNPLIPHNTYNAKTITLKGTCDQQGANLTFYWEFGDGSAVASGPVTNKYVIEAKHAYSGTDGQIFTARLTVQNTTTGESASKAYYVMTKTKTLDIEANVAIDEGLWYLHKTQYRFTSGTEQGNWQTAVGFGNYATANYPAQTAANINAFEVNGHLESGDDANPYKETVARGLRNLFTCLTWRTLTVQVGGNPDNSSPPNGIGLYVAQGSYYYQGGMVMDAIVASGTPNAVATTGDATYVANRTYKAIIQDMVDDHVWAQYDGVNATYGILGGWRYSANQAPDNSVCQWAAIGLLAAGRNWGCVIPAWVYDYNENWLGYSQNGTAGTYFGAFGYTSPTDFTWGPYATTPSAMVQMVMDGVGRGMTLAGGKPGWDGAETFIRDRFANAGNATQSITNYYYGLFSFTKSMLLYPYNGDEDASTPDPTPIKWLRSTTPGVLPLDWYAAEASKGAPCDGVARCLINGQNAIGYWTGHEYESAQYTFGTAWAIMMLHRTVFESGSPVAVAKGLPTPAIAGQTIILDGTESYHQDSARNIVQWDWDLNDDGTFDGSGPTIATSFPAVGTYPVRLRVTDDSPTPRSAETVLNIIINTPPLAPTADADGPYKFCPGYRWYLDGRNSINPDEGLHQAGNYPGDTIQEYAWDLDNNGTIDMYGATPDVTDYFSALGPGSYLVTLRVKDTTSQSFPASGLSDLTSTATAQVTVTLGLNGECNCLADLTTTPGLKKITLAWSALPTAHHYNVYRGTVAGGPYTWIASVAAPGTSYEDAVGAVKQVFYYVVRPAKINDNELCQSPEVSAEPLHPAPAVSATPVALSNTAKYFYQLGVVSQTFDRSRCIIYVQDTVTRQTEGPYYADNTLYIRTGLTAHSVKAGVAPVKAYLSFKGSATIWAEDPLGQKSAPVTIP